MSMRSILKTLISSSIILLIGACSFKKDASKEGNPITYLQDKGNTEPSWFCKDFNSPVVDDFQTLLALSTSTNEEDLCTAIWNFKRKIENKVLLPSDTEIFNNLITTITGLAKTKDDTVRNSYFVGFSNWATTFAQSNEASNRKSLIRFNNIISNSLINDQLISHDFAKHKVYLFAETDHLSQAEFNRYFDLLSNKVTLAEICSDSSVTLALKSKRYNSHVMRILEVCRSHLSAEDVVANRAYLDASVSNAEIQLFSSAISNNVLNVSSKTLSRSQILGTITTSVKRNDVGLFKMSMLAFKDRSVTFYSLALANTIEYDLEGFLKSNSGSLSEILRPLWTPKEVIAVLQSAESATLFKLFSKYDIIPNSEQTKDILKELVKTRSDSSNLMDIAGIESLFRLLKSNTYTKLDEALVNTNFADEELKIIVRGSGSSKYLSELAIFSKDSGRIYFQPATTNTPVFSISKKTKLYVSSYLFKKVYFPQDSDVSGDWQGLGYYTDGENSFYLTIEDTLNAPIGDLSNKVQWGPDYLLSPLQPAQPKELPIEVKETFTSIAEYLRRVARHNNE